ncbi:DMT family transporter [Oceanicella sp. SM1341]|uniref:DMT family transporter n=1 Tax=Oceanicella sp. SM1341 TaxID=1548889 RepID=UPI000E524B01|nr:DMT family transporter [Oceanicella sp. SM1341]
MTGWLLSIEGTPAGAHLAMLLALGSAVAHAVFGALQKGRHDPWMSRGAIDFCYMAMALPVALFVVPWPEGGLWLVLLGAWVIHMGYKLCMAMAYERAAYTVVYPVVRGTGPLVTVIAAGFVFGELFGPLQWLGVLLLSGGIFALALFNLRHVEVGRDTLLQALGLAFVTGLFVALYTTYDAFGIRAAPDPFTFLFWFFVIDGLAFPVIALARWQRMELRPAMGPLMLRGVSGAVIAFLSFGSVMLATRLDKVGEAAVLRETSTVFAALIGWLVLKDTVGPVRGALMALIAAGAVLVEFGGA